MDNNKTIAKISEIEARIYKMIDELSLTSKQRMNLEHAIEELIEVFLKS